MAVRYLISTFGAAAISLGLFLLMESLVSLPGTGLSDPLGTKMIEFVRLKRDSELELKKREIPDRQKPEPPPPPPPLQLDRAARPDQAVSGAGAVVIPELELVGGPSLGEAQADADIVPLVRVQPVYPSRANALGIEGWVEVEFTISAAGTVVDPVVVASSSGIFHSATLRAIRKWKYRPRIVDGQPVERTGVRVQLIYELAEDR